MRTLQKANGKRTVSEFREKRGVMLDKQILLWRDDNFSILLTPTRNMSLGVVCTLSGKKIEEGDYVYRCYTNPVRLSPLGPDRCLVSEAIKYGIDDILPWGMVACKLPSPNLFFNEERIKKQEEMRRRLLDQLGTKMIKGGAKYIEQPKDGK